MCDRLGAQIVLMAADDRRDTTAAFFVHYLFAHPRDRWLVIASVRVHDRNPELPSLAPSRYAVSRFEREMQAYTGAKHAIGDARLRRHAQADD